MNREQLAEIPAGTELLRAVRQMPIDSFAELTIDELDNAARWLRAASYSATEGARRIEAAIAQRQHERGTPPCTSDSNQTATNTNTAEPPPATQSEAQKSPSSSPTNTPPSN